MARSRTAMRLGRAPAGRARPVRGRAAFRATARIRGADTLTQLARYWTHPNRLPHYANGSKERLRVETHDAAEARDMATPPNTGRSAAPLQTGPAVDRLGVVRQRHSAQYDAARCAYVGRPKGR